MRLNCSKIRELSIEKLWQWVRGMQEQDPAEILRKQPLILGKLVADLPEMLMEPVISRSVWQKVLERFFFRKLTGGHEELVHIFAPFADFEPGRCCAGPHRLVSVLGSGSEACAFGTADGCCLKVVPAEKCRKLETEYHVLQRLRHPHIVRCYDLIHAPGYTALLEERLGRAPGKECDYMAGLRYCHAQGLLHGDIRLKNLGADAGGRGKLFDFANAVPAKSAGEKLQEIKMLRDAMASPIALQIKNTCAAGDVLC